MNSGKTMSAALHNCCKNNLISQTSHLTAPEHVSQVKFQQMVLANLGLGPRTAFPGNLQTAVLWAVAYDRCLINFLRVSVACAWMLSAASRNPQLYDC